MVEEKLIRFPGMPADESFEYGPRDVKGVAQDGKRWRYVGMVGASLEYEGASASSARVFDTVLDQLCWNASSRAAEQ